MGILKKCMMDEDYKYLVIGTQDNNLVIKEYNPSLYNLFKTNEILFDYIILQACKTEEDAKLYIETFYDKPLLLRGLDLNSIIPHHYSYTCNCGLTTGILHLDIICEHCKTKVKKI